MMKDTILKRTEGPYTYHVFKEIDEDADLLWLTDLTDASQYPGCTTEEIADYIKQDEERLSDYYRGDWCMVGVLCEVSIKTKTNWAIDPVIARSSIWGIESDSDESYFFTVAEEQIEEAKHDLANLREALA
jgi:hypothetical protein